MGDEEMGLREDERRLLRELRTDSSVSVPGEESLSGAGRDRRRLRAAPVVSGSRFRLHVEKELFFPRTGLKSY